MQQFYTRVLDSFSLNRSLGTTERTRENAIVLEYVKTFISESKEILPKPMKVLREAMVNFHVNTDSDEEDDENDIDLYANQLDIYMRSIVADGDVSTGMSSNLLRLFGKDSTEVKIAGILSDWKPPQSFGLNNSERIFSSMEAKKSPAPTGIFLPLILSIYHIHMYVCSQYSFFFI